jgi:tRNA(Ile)-lysidine synthetase-like protein
MLKLLGKLPNPTYVAVSGGVDSMSVLHFLRTGMNGQRKVIPVFFDHGTETSAKALVFLTEHVRNFISQKIAATKSKDQSWEEYWRDERYKFFHSLDAPVITAHHLDDQIETWLFGAIHGQPKLIPYRNGNVIRPFLLTTKSDFIEYAETKFVSWIEDDTNMEYAHARNRIRHEIVPEALLINPGLHKVIAKRVRLLTSDKK